ncbi:hypothetical protein GPA10_24905 [Streptomyces sp. p1417]|uniref:Uncharacterized protein n=1 Tax=Streptomyces typhae TaxID=2681492 RepID=A0A6L6X232_9ACTN|nr:hypothetical protein [Streptomyces typhae]MVO87908.1 hypothetical protein [Streptomyces typhae]
MTDHVARLDAPASSPVPDPSNLAVAASVGQQMLNTYGNSSRDGFTYPEAYGALRESLRILLRAIGTAAAVHGGEAL